jgi:release factor glutamine methyltransferase
VTGRPVGEILQDAAAQLKAAGIEEPWREARILLAEATGESMAAIMAWPERAVSPDRQVLFDGWLVRRLEQEPISRILGRREFWSLPFIITPATLDPRPDSETVIEAVLAAFPDRSRPCRLIDFGTGTGCLLLALLSEYPNAHGIGVDRSAAAALVARANAEALGLSGRASIIVGDWDGAVAGPVDIIVSNPPYIASGMIASLTRSVRDYDPLTALDGGADGLSPYRVLASAARRLLAPDGAAFFEVGKGQAADVEQLLRAAGFENCNHHQDLAGIARVVSAKTFRP